VTKVALNRQLRSILFAFLAALPGPALAQTSNSAPVSGSALATPIIEQVDGNGVDLLTGVFRATSPRLSTGDKQVGSDFYLSWNGRTWLPNIPTIWMDDKKHVFVQFGAISDEFDKPVRDTTAINVQGWGYPYLWKHLRPSSGAYLQCYEVGGVSGNTWFSRCRYVSRDGVTITWNGVTPCSGSYPASARYDWDVFGNTGLHLDALFQPGLGSTAFGPQPQNAVLICPASGGGSVTTSFPNGSYLGMAGYLHQANVIFSLSLNGIARSVRFYTPNLENNTDRSRSMLRPKGVTQAVTDPSGNMWTFTFNNNGDMTNLSSPSGRSSILTYDGSHRVTSFFNGATMWRYSYDFADNSTGVGTTTVTEPTGAVIRVAHLKKPGPVTSVVDALGRTTSYAYDALERLSSVTLPEGGSASYQYDANGNVTSVTKSPNFSGNEAPLVVTATYALACDTGALCHKPATITDGRGGVTQFSYDAPAGFAVTGLPTVTTSPPPSPGAANPQARNGFKVIPVYYQDANGVGQATPVRMVVLAETSACQSSSSCVGTADEVKTIFGFSSSYTANSASNNGLPISVTTLLGNGTVISSASMTYDSIGNLLSVDGPRTDIDDRRYTTYDAKRKPVFEVSADPDGTGPLPRTIVRHLYDAEGMETQTEYGTGFATDGSDFVVTRFQRMTYDFATGRLLRTEAVIP
jgi:YD repeat-containing protein